MHLKSQIKYLHVGSKVTTQPSEEETVYESDGMPLVISLVVLIALILSVTLCIMIVIRFLRLRRHDITRGYENMK